VQVVKATHYKNSLYKQSMRRIRLPGTRGRIYDRNGVCLADNRPSYCIAVYIEELRQPGRWTNTIDEVERVIGELGLQLELERRVTRADISRRIPYLLPLPFLAWSDLDSRTVARWAESPHPLPGVDIYVEPVRVYPHGGLAAHVLGYVGRADPERNRPNPYDYYLPEMAGKRGIEKSCDADLAGTAGGRLIRVDVSGFKHGEYPDRSPRSGDDVRLTIDARMQGLAEDALAGVRGACVIINPRNGDVLALTSAPAFDPEVFTPRISTAQWRRLSGNPGKPLFNRATAGTYAPGSIFKPVVAIAALENGRAEPDTKFDCQGAYQVGNTLFDCWKRGGHGSIGMRKAIEQSCNSYFCQLGLQCGYERLYHMADALGLGRKAGLALGAEASGLLPNDAWKRMQRDGDRWRSGDTCNVSIGQGALAVTPVQMAVFVATLANGGTVYRPRIVLARGDSGSWSRQLAPGVVVNRMQWSPRTLETVRGGMYDVVHAETGTGRRARVPGVLMAGKTGTAEYGSGSDLRKHGWMIVFAPFESPLYAVVMVVEDAVSGGITVAPRIRSLMCGVFGVVEQRVATVSNRQGEAG